MLIQSVALTLLISAASALQSPANPPSAPELIERAEALLKAHNSADALTLLNQAEALNPNQAKLWYTHGLIEISRKADTQALADFQKELQLHPESAKFVLPLVFTTLERAGNQDNKILDYWISAAAQDPSDDKLSTQVANALLRQKRYADAVTFLEKPIQAAPQNYLLQTKRLEAMLRAGRTEDGIKEAQRIAQATSTPMIVNNLAYDLADTDTALDLAQPWAEQAVAATEKDCSTLRLASFAKADLTSVAALATHWDTLGWVYFKQNKLDASEKYITAAWLLNPSPANAAHLGRIYEYRGRDTVQTVEALTKLRTLDLPNLPKSQSVAEFYLLLSKNGIEAAQFIGGADELNIAATAIQSAHYPFPLPDAGTEKMIRRGTLVCSPDTQPSCRIIFQYAATAVRQFGASAPVLANAQFPVSSPPSMPVLISKVEPIYSKAARTQKISGDVHLTAIIDIAGLPQNIKVIQPLGAGLDEAAVECVTQWRFRPAAKDGIPFAKQVQFEISFRLSP